MKSRRPPPISGVPWAFMEPKAKIVAEEARPPKYGTG
jgi:hypothetical protein